jgi:predicted O-linked N-acetylglucosamine transferase (SPINDLY family)
VPVCYARPDVPSALASRSAFGVADDAHLYACIQNVRKVHPDMHALVGEILRRDPKGVVLFTGDRHPAVADHLRSALGAALPDVADRVRILPRLDPERYHGLIAAADCLLDTPHYSGGANTFFDALAHAAPVVTLPGPTQRSRYTSASYAQIGVTETSATSPTAYVETALHLAADASVRSDLQHRIRDRGGELFDDRAPIFELADWLEQTALESRS